MDWFEPGGQKRFDFSDVASETEDDDPESDYFRASDDRARH